MSKLMNHPVNLNFQFFISFTCYCIYYFFYSFSFFTPSIYRDKIKDEYLMMLKHKRFQYTEKIRNKYVVLPYKNPEYTFLRCYPS